MHDNIKKQKRIFSVPKFKIQYERNDGEIIKKRRERKNTIFPKIKFTK